MTTLQPIYETKQNSRAESVGKYLGWLLCYGGAVYLAAMILRGFVR